MHSPHVSDNRLPSPVPLFPAYPSLALNEKRDDVSCYCWTHQEMMKYDPSCAASGSLDQHSLQRHHHCKERWHDVAYAPNHR